jgi:hypothetical protein
VDWAIYGALIAGFLAVAGAAAFLGVRVLEAWRDLKRLRRQVARALERLAELTEATAVAAERAGDQTQLTASLGRLRVTLARLAVIRAALDEATDAFGRVVAVYPRK